MAKIRSELEEVGGLRIGATQEAFRKPYVFYCVGCKRNHRVALNVKIGDGNIQNRFNKDYDNPTVKGTFLFRSPRCHFSITEGKLVYENDCKHKLAGKTVEMVDL